MSKPKHSIESLLAEVSRLRNRNHWLTEKLAEAERLLGRRAPILTLYFQAKPIRIFADGKAPVALAEDVITLIPDAPPPQKRGTKTYTVAVQRFRSMGLGDREAFGIPRTDLSERFGITESSISESLGVSTKTHIIGVVTPLGIETLRGHAPDLCAWLLDEMAKATKQLSDC